MNGSRTVRVAKRDGTFESFDRDKLAAAMYKVLRPGPQSFCDAREVALAIEIYLDRRGWATVSSAAIFEMLLKTFRRIGMDLPAAMMETHHTWRARRRRSVRVSHGDGRATLWDKGWLVKLIRSSWRLGSAAGRTLAGDIEIDLLEASDGDIIGRDDLIEKVNALVAAYGLADAVPVEQHSLET